MTKRLTRQQAINQHCKDCCYDEKAGGTWKKQVQLCPMTDCALYNYRPLPQGVKHTDLIPTEEI
jgi:hypothetical protein